MLKFIVFKILEGSKIWHVFKIALMLKLIVLKILERSKIW